MARSKIANLIADEARAAEDAEADQDSPIPPNVKITRGSARSKVLQVRLNDDEFAELERIAARRQLPTSTIARESLLDLIASESDAQPVARLRAAVARLDSLVGEVNTEFSARIAEAGMSANQVADVADKLGLITAANTPSAPIS